MDPKTVKAAKEIPARLMDVVTAMFEESKPTLRTGVAGLRGALNKVEAYLQEVEREHLAGTSGKATPKAGKRTTKKGQFPISEFVLETLASSGKPLKPAAIVSKLKEAGSGHAHPSGAVNNCLARLKKEGKVKRMKTGWKVAR